MSQKCPAQHRSGNVPHRGTAMGLGRTKQLSCWILAPNSVDDVRLSNTRTRPGTADTGFTEPPLKYPHEKRKANHLIQLHFAVLRHAPDSVTWVARHHQEPPLQCRKACMRRVRCGQYNSIEANIRKHISVEVSCATSKCTARQHLRRNL